MSIAQIRLILIKRIVEADEEVLKEILSVLKLSEEATVGYDAEGNPQYAGVLRAELEEDLKEAKEGKYISLKELKNRSDEWLTGTK